MALRVVSMEELRLEVLLEPDRTGETVAEVCARHGISRASCYRYRRRYLDEGAAGLTPRSRRPRSSPARIEPALEARIVELRRRQRRWGARRIHAEPRVGGDRAAGGGNDPPGAPAQPPGRSAAAAAAEGEQALRARAGERPLADRRDRVALAGGERAWVVDCLDDHARFLLAAIACASPSGEAAWDCFAAASSAHGLPRQLLSDNHMSFTGRLHGFRSPSSVSSPRSASS